MAKKKNPAAVALGRLGGRAKVKKGFAVLSPQKREEIRALGLAKRRAKKP